MDLAYVKNPYAPDLTCHLCGVNNSERFVHPATPQTPASWRPDRPYISDQPICGPCFRTRAAESGGRLHEQEPNIPAWVEEQLTSVGLAPEERRAKLDQIPQVLLDAIPDSVLTPLLAGAVPKQGLGLAGIAGVGKSSAMAALIRVFLLQNATCRAPFLALEPVTKLFWLNVSLACHRWRRDGLDWRVDRDISKASKAKLLVLDDLGRETRRREASEDVATSHLDAIITARDREGLVTLWTTNLSEEELFDRYGTGMVRRLLGLNPMAWLTGAGLHPESM